MVVQEIYTWFNKMWAGFQNVTTKLFETYEIFGNTFTLFDMILGIGVPTVIGVILVKWLVDFIS